MFIKIQRMLEADAGTGSNGAGNTGNPDTTTQTDNVDNSNDNTTQPEKTFTQKDVDKLIQDRLAREQSKWEKIVQDERTEAEKIAKMNAEQKAKYEEEKRNAELEKRERDITVREFRAIAREEGFPEELLEFLDYSSLEAFEKSKENLKKAVRSASDKDVNERLRGTNMPTGSGLGGSNTKGFGFSFTGVRNKK